MSTSAPGYGWDIFFSLLNGYGFRPRCVIDVGANHGHWTRKALNYFPAARYLLIEPQDHLKASVADLPGKGFDIHWITAGVSDQSGTIPLTIAPDDTSSNFGMTPEAAAAHGYRQTMVEVRTLDEIVDTLGWPAPEMLKIDAEGFDLKVLAGAKKLMSSVDVVFLEAAVCATGIENTMAAVIQKMDELDFRMVDVTDLNRSPKHGVLWLAELAFIRNGCPLLAEISSYR